MLVPDRAARTLLKVIAHNPEAVKEALAGQLDLEDWREVVRAYQQTGQEAKVLLDVLRTT